MTKELVPLSSRFSEALVRRADDIAHREQRVVRIVAQTLIKHDLDEYGHALTAADGSDSPENIIAGHSLTSADVTPPRDGRSLHLS